MSSQCLIGYFENNKNDIVYFDVFFRKVPDHGGYAIVCGLEQIIEYVQNLRFEDGDIEYLKSQNMFSDKYLEYLKNFKFTGDIWAIPEGTVVFPNEPLITIRAPAIEAQILETAILVILNHQSLIATKTARIVRAASRKTSYGIWSKKSTWSIFSNLWGKSCNYWWSSSEHLAH